MKKFQWGDIALVRPLKSFQIQDIIDARPYEEKDIFGRYVFIEVKSGHEYLLRFTMQEGSMAADDLLHYGRPQTISICPYCQESDGYCGISQQEKQNLLDWIFAHPAYRLRLITR